MPHNFMNSYQMEMGSTMVWKRSNGTSSAQRLKETESAQRIKEREADNLRHTMSFVMPAIVNLNETPNPH